jgi:hypothetical protein
LEHGLQNTPVDHCVPALPRAVHPRDLQGHREKIRSFEGLYPACIARKVSKNEVQRTPAAKAALDKEWEKLANHKRPDPKDKGVGCWDVGRVMEVDEVRAQARKEGKKVHIGRICELCVQKNSELKDDDPLKKYKGRAVFLGDNVKDEYFDWAEFGELGSNPPTMEAAKSLDCLGCLPGYSVKTGDAKGAYTQSYLKAEIVTWVHLPRDRWPKSWEGKYKNPVVPLVLALYGHPEAGGYWEEHCESKILALGWVKIGWEWPSVFWHPVKKAMLVISVDDFQLAAIDQDHDELWRGIKSVIDMDDETDDGRFLGCLHEPFTAKSKDVKEILELHPQYHPRSSPAVCPYNDGTVKAGKSVNTGTPAGKSVNTDVPTPNYLYDPERTIVGRKYNMQDYVDECVVRFCELSGADPDKIKPAPTPFIDESQDPFDAIGETDKKEITRNLTRAL